MADAGRYNALIIDPMPEARSALKELLHSDQLFRQLVYKGVFLVGNFIDAITTLSATPIDVIFISGKYPADELERFILTAKDSEQPHGTAYILVLNQNDDGSALVARGLALGADGFLVMPCSVEQLRNITSIAQKVKSVAQERMVKVALNLLIDTLLTELEAKVAEYYARGQVTGFKRQLKDAASQLMGDKKDSHTQFFELLDTAVKRAAPSARNRRVPKSKRVQKLFEDQNRDSEPSSRIIRN